MNLAVRKAELLQSIDEMSHKELKKQFEFIIRYSGALIKYDITLGPNVLFDLLEDNFRQQKSHSGQ